MYLDQLTSKIGEHDEFIQVQCVMDASFAYLHAPLRRRFLVLHFFPDQFTMDDAAKLWDVSTVEAKQTLGALVAFSLVSLTRSPEGAPLFLVLDHIWVFAAARAEAVGCASSEWLTRAEYAEALTRLLRLAYTRWPPAVHSQLPMLPRLYHAAAFHARRVRRELSDGGRCEGGLLGGSAHTAAICCPQNDSTPALDVHVDDFDHSPPAYRSLGQEEASLDAPEPYAERVGGATTQALRERLALRREDIPPSLAQAANELLLAAPAAKGGGAAAIPHPSTLHEGTIGLAIAAAVTVAAAAVAARRNAT